MTSQPHPRLADVPVVVTMPGQWGEMDAYGHVNNTVLFRYFETARVEFLERCGFARSYDDHKIGAILHSTSCRFRLALHYPDTIQVGGRAVSMQEDRFTMEYKVVSLKHDTLVAEGEGVIVAFDYTSRTKTVIPDAVREGIRRLNARLQQ
jgi:acyl-CoA thioester hydrolase